MVSSISSLQVALANLQSSASSGGFDFSIFAQGASGSSGVYSGANAKVALQNAENNKDKSVAQLKKDPQIQKDIAHYTEVVQNAKSIDDVLNDPIARKVLMTANGLGQYVDSVGLAKKAMMSDPSDSNSLAAQLQSTDSAWLQFAQNYNLAANGLDRLSPQMNGYAGKWKVTVQRDGQPLDAELDITKNGTQYTAAINGTQIPMSVETDGSVTLNIIYDDANGDTHLSHLTGTIGKDGSMSGLQTEDGAKLDQAWSAVPYYSTAIQTVADNYVNEKWLDQLDKQLPGLGSAITFKGIASTLDTTVKVLGSPLGREIVTVGLSIPKQIALQSVEAQVKAVDAKLDVSQLQNPDYVDRLVQRYLMQLNGGTSGVTA
ncbi:MAG TPA: DUF1217 domain-containing protein [Hyphomonadaceae bacterium]|nr:DUF1217 domain-containing protein [Hyphomonadaceae bacterium]